MFNVYMGLVKSSYGGASEPKLKPDEDKNKRNLSSTLTPDAPSLQVACARGVHGKAGDAQNSAGPVERLLCGGGHERDRPGHVADPLDGLRVVPSRAVEEVHAVGVEVQLDLHGNQGPAE